MAGAIEIRNLKSKFLPCRVSPGECGFTSSDGDPGTNGVTSKTRCGRPMNTMTHEMQVAFPGKARLYPGRTGPEVCPPTGYISIMSSGNSFPPVDLFGKCAASVLPV